MIPDELKNLNQWVCVSYYSKVPMKAWEYEPASSSAPETWATYNEALKSVTDGHYAYMGFVFADNGLIGIDIDVGYEDGLISEISTDIIGKCKSYTEKSKSGRGFHIILKGNLPFNGRNNRKGVEIYKTARYFIMTGKTLLYDKIIENQQAIDYVVSKYFAENEKISRGSITNKIYVPLWNDVVIGNKIRLYPFYPEIPIGCRNISLTSLAGMMHNIGYSKKQIYNELVHVNKTVCEPPLEDKEIQVICTSITRYKK